MVSYDGCYRMALNQLLDKWSRLAAVAGMAVAGANAQTRVQHFDYACRFPGPLFSEINLAGFREPGESTGGKQGGEMLGGNWNGRFHLSNPIMGVIRMPAAKSSI